MSFGPDRDDDREDEDGPPPWEAESCRLFAGRICARHVGLDRLQQALVNHPHTPGEAADRWVMRLGRARRQRPPTVREEAIEPPERIATAMRRCQKPFQLWNVNRVQQTEPYALEPGPELKLGGAADLPEELRVPRRVEKATTALKEWVEDQEFEAMLRKGDARRLKQALREPLPFGKPDPKGDGVPGGKPARPPAVGGFGGFGGFGGPPGPGPGQGFPGFGAPPPPTPGPPGGFPGFGAPGGFPGFGGLGNPDDD